MSSYSPKALCPCGSGIKYRKCCRPYHKGLEPEKPETLMRSRYSAYAVGEIDYLVHTTCPGHPDLADLDALRKGLQVFVNRMTFVGLQILAVEDGEDDDTGYVTFRASLLEDMQDRSFTERSLFKRHDGCWCYARNLKQT